MKHKNCTCNS